MEHEFCCGTDQQETLKILFKQIGVFPLLFQKIFRQLHKIKSHRISPVCRAVSLYGDVTVEIII